MKYEICPDHKGIDKLQLERKLLLKLQCKLIQKLLVLSSAYETIVKKLEYLVNMNLERTKDWY